MKKYNPWLASLFALVLLAGCGKSPSPVAGSMASIPTVTPNKLTVVGAMANEVPAVAVNGAVYLTVLNGTAQTVHLVAAQSDIAEQITFHETINDNGVMRMTQPTAGFAIEAGASLILVPGEKHLMLENLRAPLKPDTPFTLTLTFDNAETFVITVPVLPLGGAEMEPDTMDHGTMDHGTMDMPMPTETEHDHTGN